MAKKNKFDIEDEHKYRWCVVVEPSTKVVLATREEYAKQVLNRWSRE